MQFQQQLKLSTNEAVAHITVGSLTVETADILSATTVHEAQAVGADNTLFGGLTYQSCKYKLVLWMLKFR